MITRQQYQLDSLRRVQDFLDTHLGGVGPLNNSEARKQLDAAVTALSGHVNDQGTAGLDMAGQASRQKALITDLKTSHMQPIARFARAKLRGAPDFAALTRSLAGLSPKQLVGAARAMATAAAPQADALTRGGFPADTLAQLGAAADAVNLAMVDRANTKVGRAGATQGIKEQLGLGREAVAMLNAVVGKQFASDAPFLAAWRVARRVTAKPGTVRGLAAVPAPAAAVSPAPTVVGVPETAAQIPQVAAQAA